MGSRRNGLDRLSRLKVIGLTVLSFRVAGVARLQSSSNKGRNYSWTAPEFSFHAVFFWFGLHLAI